jgi:hypothetical protein
MGVDIEDNHEIHYDSLCLGQESNPVRPQGSLASHGQLIRPRASSEIIVRLRTSEMF